MSFRETVRLAKDYLQEESRVSLRALKREFDLDDEILADLVEEPSRNLRRVRPAVNLVLREENEH